MGDNFESLKKYVDDGVKEHDHYQSQNAYLYNYLIVIAIICTSSAAILPLNPDDTWITKLLAGVGAIIISLDRALNFGSRWVYHRQMRHGYLSIAAKISFYENLPLGYSEEEKKKIFQEIYQGYYLMKQKEAEIPGINFEKKIKGS
jgi:hypothetical protein